MRICLSIFIVFWRSINMRERDMVTKTRVTKRIKFVETNLFKIFSWELCTFFMKPSIADLTWNFLLRFPEHFPFTKPTFCTAVLDKQRKLSNKCRPVSEEYQINSSHQTVVHFESKFISIRKAKLCYITTLPFPRRALF